MPLETAEYFDTLQPDWPLGTDPESQGDDHIRMVKQVIQNTFPAFNSAIAGTSENVSAISTGLTYNAADADAGTAASWSFTDPADPATPLPVTAAPMKGESAVATLGMLYPVGAVIINTGTNPADYLGFGTWTARAGSIRGVGAVTDSQGMAQTLSAGAFAGYWRVQSGHVVAATMNLASGTATSAGAHSHTTQMHLGGVGSTGSGSTHYASTGAGNADGSPLPSNSAGAHTHPVTGTVTFGSGTTTSGSAMINPGYHVYVWERTA